MGPYDNEDELYTDGEPGHDNPNHESFHAWEVEVDEAEQQIEDYWNGVDYD